jgi:hypothetical protein
VLLLGTVAHEASAAPTIIFRDGALDRFKFHGRVLLPPPELGGPIDPVRDGFGVELSNEFGVLYEGWLGPGDLQPLGKMRYRFRDKLAPEGAGSRDGLGFIFTRFRQYADGWYYTVRIMAYEELSAATVPRMTVTFHQVGMPAQLTVEWVPMQKGWRLPLNRFP